MVSWRGERRRFGPPSGPAAFALHFKSRTAFLRTMMQSTLGFGEAYVAGDVVVEGSLEDALATFASLDLRRPSRSPIPDLVRGVLARTRSREKAALEKHYGRGTEFYALYLDKKLQHSCGYFRTGVDSLDQAQEQKILHTARKLDLKRGQRLLDIGCGWGHLMFHVAEKYGIECLGITMSDSQTTYIREQARLRKLPVKARTMNYLDLDERARWERIVSVGMMSHVGERRADAFYDKLERLAAPQAIVLTDCISKMKEEPGSDPFVDKHVLPGHWFFSLEGETKRAAHRGFNVLDVENLRRHHALTAHHWRRNFLANYTTIKRKMHYDDRFMRTWDFYLASLVAGFRSGQLNSIQMTMSYGATDDYPLTRDFLYERDRPRLIAAAMPSMSLRTRNISPS